LKSQLLYFAAVTFVQLICSRNGWIEVAERGVPLSPLRDALEFDCTSWLLAPPAPPAPVRFVYPVTASLQVRARARVRASGRIEFSRTVDRSISFAECHAKRRLIARGIDRVHCRGFFDFDADLIDGDNTGWDRQGALVKGITLRVNPQGQMGPRGVKAASNVFSCRVFRHTRDYRFEAASIARCNNFESPPFR